MPNLDVKIVHLEPMRVACAHVVGEDPEHDAWVKLRDWAEPKGLLADIEKHPVFGFNNPNPTEDQKEYGYELWIRVDSDAAAEGDITVKVFPGGLFAVTTCMLMNDPNGNLPEVWMKLFEWVKASEYCWAKTQELEKLHDVSSADEDLVLDLYLPVEG
jgi:DNA gyrase inhibitor GyrI